MVVENANDSTGTFPEVDDDMSLVVARVECEEVFLKNTSYVILLNAERDVAVSLIPDVV